MAHPTVYVCLIQQVSKSYATVIHVPVGVFCLLIFVACLKFSREVIPRSMTTDRRFYFRYANNRKTNDVIDDVTQLPGPGQTALSNEPGIE